MSANQIYKTTRIHGKSVFTIALIIMLSASSVAITLPFANAKDVQLYAYLSVAPDPVGVDQAVSVIFWLSIPPPTAEGAFGDRWEGMTVDIEKPDGSTETKGPYTSDAVGSAFFVYVPDQVGTYSFQMHFLGQILQGNNRAPGSSLGEEFIGDNFLPATSNTVEITVQQEPIAMHPEVPLPTGYWTRPVYGENTNWAPIASNWLLNGYDYNGRFFDVGSAYNPYTRAPNAAHIIWKRPIDDGGIVGGAGAIDGSEQIVGYYNGMSYEAKFTPPLVINGRLYYNIYPSGARPGYVVVDLYTGEELWRKEDQILSIGQIYDYESFNQHGSQSYLWSLTGSTWNMSDAFTGDVLVQVENATGGGMPVFSSNGDLLIYYLSGTQNTLALWNSSKCIPPAGPTGSNAFQWRPERFPEVDWSDGIEWNVSVPDVPGSQGLRTATKTFNEEILVAASLIPATETELAYVYEVAYDARTGAQLWEANRADRQQTPQNIWILLDYGNIEDGIFTYRVRDQLITYGYNASTGQQLWVSPSSEDAWSMFPSANWNVYGKNYITSYSGKIEAYDLQTGSFLWEYFGGSAGFDTPYGVRPFYSGLLFADGKIFASNSEHSPSQPMWKGQKLHVVNAENGQQVWNLSGWFTSHQNIIVDGYFIGHNGYDNQIYCIGIGQSKTTVDATPSTITAGAGVLITGTVTDQSPASKDTPAINDQDMTAWMEYLHMQQECPMTVRGVNVVLKAYTQDGTEINIGTTQSDGYGKYGFFWQPPQPGMFRIVATFEGSASYGSSADETFVGVAESGGGVPTGSPTGNGGIPTGSPTSPPPPGNGTPIEWYIIAAVIIVVIVVVLAALILSRRTK